MLAFEGRQLAAPGVEALSVIDLSAYTLMLISFGLHYLHCALLALWIPEAWRFIELDESDECAALRLNSFRSTAAIIHLLRVWPTICKSNATLTLGRVSKDARDNKYGSQYFAKTL
jgi:hypothetical protein